MAEPMLREPKDGPRACHKERLVEPFVLVPAGLKYHCTTFPILVPPIFSGDQNTRK